MHELWIASAIAERVLEFSETNPSRKVLGVRVLVGELSCIEPEQLSFCYTAIVKETVLENSVLEIERLEAEVLCPHCSYRGRPKILGRGAFGRGGCNVAMSAVRQGHRGLAGARVHYPDHPLCLTNPATLSASSRGKVSTFRSSSRESTTFRTLPQGQCSRSA